MHEQKDNEKIYELLKHDENTKELFYRFYYKIKEENQVNFIMKIERRTNCK